MNGLSRRVGRRAVLAGTAGLLTGQVLAKAIPPHAPQAFRNATSLSPFAEYLFSAGMTFTDGTAIARNAEQLQHLFINHGATEVFARVGTRRGFQRELGDHSIQRGLDRARIARNLKVPLNVELGLFAYYGDVSFQPAPDFSDYATIRQSRPWLELTVEEMAHLLHDYGAMVAREVLATGVTVNVWDIGNEVEYGSAGIAVPSIVSQRAGWAYRRPDAVDKAIGRSSLQKLQSLSEAARIDWLSNHIWPHIGRLFAATANGIRSIDPSARFSTHVSGLSAYSSAMLIAFYRAMDEAGFRADQLGTSYYPSSSSVPAERFAAFKEAVTTAHSVLKRQVFVAEFAYPTGPFRFGGEPWNNAVSSYPISVRGQAEFYRDLAAWGVGSSVISGIRPWAPEVVAPEWRAMSMFDSDGLVARARPSLGSISQGVSAARKLLPKPVRQKR